jgi:hypothetical protein
MPRHQNTSFRPARYSAALVQRIRASTVSAYAQVRVPFRQEWLETTTGRYVRMSTLVSVELLTLDPDDPRLTS